MDFSENQTSRDVHNRTLPQFSELRPNHSTNSEDAQCLLSDEKQQRMLSQISSQIKAYIEKNSSRYFNANQTSDPLEYDLSDSPMQLCEKQIINVPNLSQNNPMLSVQLNSLSSNLNNMYPPPISLPQSRKRELDNQSRKQINSNKESQAQFNQQTVTEVFQKLQAAEITSLLMALQEARKPKMTEEEVEQTQNNILNIPDVRSLYQNSRNLDQIETINSNDLNKILQNEQHENESNLQTTIKVEQQVQTDLPKNEKKLKFRAKIGEIKVNLGYNGTTLYCCPECNIGYPKKSDTEQHIQAHLQERKYQCKLCGAMLKRKEHLDQHMRGHSDERPYKCQICTKAFKRNEHLTRHSVIHSGAKEFNCTLCQKAFSRKDHLNKHIQTHYGVRKNKTKEEPIYISQKDPLYINQKDPLYISQKDTTRLFENVLDPTVKPKQETTYILKDNSLLAHELQNLQKQTLLQVFSFAKDQIAREANEQAQTDNTNARYLMPS
ncbi:zinc finger protein 37-like [Nylanderia fulva]|uniref:zinc finger protein 37-like n=1 Tax=Nylanderia fulva TaxID=613905 RepID=UPI0010FAE922|nr:zinc finger protein 37-like [Nylanderia fulva]